MIRKTNTTQVGTRPLPSQLELDKFWGWIDGTPQTDEMWRVQANGDMVLVVDEETLVGILEDDMNKAHEDFDTFTMRDNETGEWDLYQLPYNLLGTYTIRGIYNDKQELVSGEVTYFFSQEF